MAESKSQLPLPRFVQGSVECFDHPQISQNTRLKCGYDLSRSGIFPKEKAISFTPSLGSLSKRTLDSLGNSHIKPKKRITPILISSQVNPDIPAQRKSSSPPPPRLHSRASCPVPNYFQHDVFAEMRPTGLLGASLLLDAHAKREEHNWLETAHLVYDSLLQHNLSVEPTAVAFGSARSQADHFLSAVFLSVGHTILKFYLRLYPPGHLENMKNVETSAICNSLIDDQRFSYHSSIRIKEEFAISQLFFAECNGGILIAVGQSVSTSVQLFTKSLKYIGKLSIDHMSMITCVQLDGDCIYIGDNNGGLSTWNIRDFTLGVDPDLEGKGIIKPFFVYCRNILTLNYVANLCFPPKIVRKRAIPDPIIAVSVFSSNGTYETLLLASSTSLYILKGEVKVIKLV
jgi:hypothetical protein